MVFWHGLQSVLRADPFHRSFVECDTNMFIRFKVPWGFLLAAGMCFSPFREATALAAGSETATLVKRVEHLIDLRRTEGAERTQWERQQDALSRRHELLEAEKSLLLERIAAHEAHMSDLHETAEAAAVRLAARNQVFDEAKGQLGEAESRLDAARATVPDGLRGDLPQTATPDRPLTERVGQWAALVDGLLRLDRTLHLQRQLLPAPDEARRHFDVLYLGLSQGYAVSPDQQLAGHGVRTASGWVWSWDPDWADAVRRAIRIQRGELEPRQIWLPVATADTAAAGEGGRHD